MMETRRPRTTVPTCAGQGVDLSAGKWRFTRGAAAPIHVLAHLLTKLLPLPQPGSRRACQIDHGRVRSRSTAGNQRARDFSSASLHSASAAASRRSTRTRRPNFRLMTKRAFLPAPPRRGPSGSERRSPICDGRRAVESRQRPCRAGRAAERRSTRQRNLRLQEPPRLGRAAVARHEETCLRPAYAKAPKAKACSRSSTMDSPFSSVTISVAI